MALFHYSMTFIVKGSISKDGIISLQYPFFTFILFLLPIAWAIGVLYDELESRVIDNGNDHESQR